MAARVAQLLGLPGVRLDRVAGGVSRGAFTVTPLRGGEPVAFLRLDEGGGGLSGTTFSLTREAVLLQALASTDLPVPRVLGTLEEPPALLMQLVPGQARLTREESEAVGPEYMGLLAQIHQLDPAPLLPDSSTDGAAALSEDLAWWTELARSGGADACPLVPLALTALELSRPPTAEARLLHGDAGAGNFLAHDGRVSGLIDWEMAHTGDRHEDLAWVCLRTVFTPFGRLPERLAEYERASGRPIDLPRLHWYQALVAWKSLVAVESQLRSPQQAASATVAQLVTLTYQPLLALLLLRVLTRPELRDGVGVDVAAQLEVLLHAAESAASTLPLAGASLERARRTGLLA